VARGSYEARDVEEVERERGNAEFKGGNFSAAVKCYTKCLGLKARNYVAFSNRAMAYLKLKEYARAVVRM
jgi:tetratricopeptide (TPR) repeat protein